MTQWQLTIPQEVRFVDLDAMGHVNNAHFLTYMEQARVAFFKKLYGGAVPTGMKQAFPFVIARIEIDFNKPIELQHKVETSIRVSAVGGKSFQLEYRIVADGDVAATAKSVQVAYDHHEKKSMPLSEEFKKKLQTV